VLIGAFLTVRSNSSHQAQAIVDTATTPVPTTFAPTTTTTTPMPAPITPLASGAVAGEGAWVAAGRSVNGHRAVLTTTLRPPGGGPPVGIARVDTNMLKVIIFAGTNQPGGAWSAQGSVPVALQSALTAAFNGGFQFGAAAGGFYADGHAEPALRDGAASLVVRTDGSAEVDQWGRDATLTPDISQVRQNLTLLVDGASPTPEASSWGAWGATLSHTSSTWRSAVGSDDHHHLYFVGGPGMTPAALAAVLVAAGAQRAMELDINPQWVFFYSYADAPDGKTTPVGAKLIPSMNYPPEHVLVPDWRDFVAVFEKPQ
jgi:hypothetical protein